MRAYARIHKNARRVASPSASFLIRSRTTTQQHSSRARASLSGTRHSCRPRRWLGEVGTPRSSDLWGEDKAMKMGCCCGTNKTTVDPLDFEKTGGKVPGDDRFQSPSAVHKQTRRQKRDAEAEDRGSPSTSRRTPGGDEIPMTSLSPAAAAYIEPLPDANRVRWLSVSLACSLFCLCLFFFIIPRSLLLPSNVQRTLMRASPVFHHLSLVVPFRVDQSLIRFLTRGNVGRARRCRCPSGHRASCQSKPNKWTTSLTSTPS